MDDHRRTCDMQRKLKGPHARKKKPQNPVHPGFFLVTPLILIAVATAWPNLSWPWDSAAAAQSTQATDTPEQNLLQQLTTMKQDMDELKTLLKKLVTRVDELDETAAAIVHIENVTRTVETQAATMQNLNTLVEKIDGVAKIAQVEVLTTRVDALEREKTEQVKKEKEKTEQVTVLTTRVDALEREKTEQVKKEKEKTEQVTVLTTRVDALEREKTEQVKKEKEKTEQVTVLTTRVDALEREKTEQVKKEKEKTEQVTVLTTRVDALEREKTEQVKKEEKTEQVTVLTTRVDALEREKTEQVKKEKEKTEQVTVLTTRVDALEKEKTEQVKKEQVTGLTTRVTTLEAAASRVAFSAMIKDNNEFKSGEKVIFSEVWTNVGDDYDESTGIFKARIGGLYFFTVTIHTHGGDIELHVYKNEEQMTYMYNPTKGYHGSETNSLVMQLKIGDIVYVKADDYRVKSNTLQSMFSGFLIHRM
ncbi:reticulocyte-binding protein homolog 2b-like isoform X3 [Dunckerocampus dactyliophorus]|uniref:reticulocyte-binding protein homolog 2b-like isoform X3 n=1 Tax=Dunckerocampus dactyliophorus TaxID=161453 RepID=UPI0024062C46|nr:reticulocyte-binding protein homolog 2b-like isoform X3 [Dunckerocampus dactyliophorus]